jgi:hypothetical protein
LASPILWIGNAVNNVSTPAILGAFFDLNFSEKLGFTILSVGSVIFEFSSCSGKLGTARRWPGQHRAVYFWIRARSAPQSGGGCALHRHLEQSVSTGFVVGQWQQIGAK